MRTFPLALIALALFLFTGGFCAPGELPCESDPFACRNPDEGFVLDPGCTPNPALEVELGHGEKRFSTLAPGEAPKEHFGNQGGSHLFAALRLRGVPFESHPAVRVRFRMTQPDTDRCPQPPAHPPRLLPDPVDFGEVAVGASLSRPISLTNPASLPLELTRIHITPRFEDLDQHLDFDILDGNRDNATLPASPLAPGASWPLSLSFSPTAEGARFAQLTVAYVDDAGAPAELLFGLTGNGANLSPTNLCQRTLETRELVMTADVFSPTDDGAFEAAGLLFFEAGLSGENTLSVQIEDACGGVAYDAITFTR